MHMYKHLQERESMGVWQGFLGRNPEDDRDHFGKKRCLVSDRP